MSERLADSAAVLLFRGRSDGRGYAVKAGWAHHFARRGAVAHCAGKYPCCGRHDKRHELCAQRRRNRRWCFKRRFIQRAAGACGGLHFGFRRRCSGTHPAIRTERTVRQNGICISCHCNCLGGYRHKLSEADGGLYKADPVADLRGGVYCLPLHLCKKSEPDQPEYRIRNLVRRWTDCHLAGFDFCIQGKTLHGWNHRSCADYRRLRNGERLWKQVIAALCVFAVPAGATPMNGCEVTYV